MATMTPQELSTKLCELKVHGLTQTFEGEEYYNFVTQNVTPGGYIAEIGSWQGFSTSYFALAARALKAKMIAIDWFGQPTRNFKAEAQWGPSTYPYFEKNLKALGMFDEIIVIPQMADQAVEKMKQYQPLNFLFIDGMHEYEPVMRNISDYAPLISPNGWMFFHDANGDEKIWGVWKACCEHPLMKERFEHKHNIAGSTVAFQRTK